MLKTLIIYGNIFAVLGLLFTLISLDQYSYKGLVFILLFFAVVCFVTRAILIRWDRFAEKKWNVTKETKDNG